AASEQTIAIRASVRPKEARIHIFLLLPKIDLFQSLFEEARRCYHKTRGYGSAFIQGIAGAKEKRGAGWLPAFWTAMRTRLEDDFRGQLTVAASQLLAGKEGE